MDDLRHHIGRLERSFVDGMSDIKVDIAKIQAKVELGARHMEATRTIAFVVGTVCVCIIAAMLVLK